MAGIQSQKIRRARISSSPDDVLMRTAAQERDGERHEPVFVAHESHSELPSFPAQELEAQIVQEEHFPEEVAANVRQTYPSIAKDLPVDFLVDCVIPLSLEGVARGEKILPVLQTLRYVGNKPVHFIGQRE